MMFGSSDEAANAMVFQSSTAPGPLKEAVLELCRKTGRGMAEMEQLTMGQISALAQEAYGEELPEFWQVWDDWNRPDLEQPMGDL